MITIQLKISCLSFNLSDCVWRINQHWSRKQFVHVILRFIVCDEWRAKPINNRTQLGICIFLLAGISISLSDLPYDMRSSVVLCANETSWWQQMSLIYKHISQTCLKWVNHNPVLYILTIGCADTLRLFRFWRTMENHQFSWNHCTRMFIIQ